MQKAIHASIIRGGTSKGIYFLEKNLPQIQSEKDNLFLKVMGSPDVFGLQMNGLGSATSSTSKIAIINQSNRVDCDVDYTFGQVSINNPSVDYSGNCGNLTAGVAIFSIYENLIKDQNNNFKDKQNVSVRIWQKNIQQRIVAHVQCQNGIPLSFGDYKIAGLSGGGSEIKLDFEFDQNSSSSYIFPTGNPTDRLELYGQFKDQKIEASLVQVGNPTVFVRAEDVNKLLNKNIISGYDNKIEDPLALDLLENIRCAGACKMGLGENPQDINKLRPATPKICILAQSNFYTSSDNQFVHENDYDISARIISMGKLHHAFTGTGSIALGASCLVPDSISYQMMPKQIKQCLQKEIRIGHRSGILDINLEVTKQENKYKLAKVMMSRTARLLMKGDAYYQDDIQLID